MTRRIAAGFIACALAAGGCATAPEREGAHLPPVVSRFSASPADAALPHGWRPWTLSRFKRTTDYTLVERDGRTVVKAAAEGSASGLVHSLDLDPDAYSVLTWEWKVNELIAAADNTRKEAEDSPVRIVVSFDGDLDKLPFEERVFGDLFRLATGRPLPYATLMYIWENRVAEGTVIPSRHTSRIKMVVARSGRAGLGEWVKISRNVAEDYRRAFGGAPGRITAVAIMTDTDNTGARASAYYGDIRFHRGMTFGITDLR